MVQGEGERRYTKKGGGDRKLVGRGGEGGYGDVGEWGRRGVDRRRLYQRNWRVWKRIGGRGVLVVRGKGRVRGIVGRGGQGNGQ